MSKCGSVINESSSGATVSGIAETVPLQPVVGRLGRLAPCDGDRTVPLGEEPLSHRALVRSRSIRDTEALGSKLLSSHRLQVTDRSGFDAHINGVSLPGVSLYYMRYRAALEVAAPTVGSYFSILLPLEGGLELRQGRTNIETSAGRGAAVIAPTQPLVMKWSPDLSMFCLKIDVAPLQHFAASLNADGAIAFQPEVRDPETLHSLLGCVRLAELVTGRLRPGQRIPGALAARIRDHMLLTLLIAQPNTLSEQLITDERAAGRAALRTAIDLIEAFPATATPRQIAKKTGISLRALEENFRDSLATTPSAYILRIRLQRAREDLLGAGSSHAATVKDVASRWGFTNPGRFAEQYRVAYGENPSDTRRRAHPELGRVDKVDPSPMVFGHGIENLDA
jgi:AraC-like DNA-binding protein